MKKLLFLVILGASGYFLYTHWDEAGEMTHALDSRPYGRLSDADLLKQQTAIQQRVLELYRQKDALHANGSKSVKFLYQAQELEASIITEKQNLENINREQVIRQFTGAAALALAVGLPALIFVGLIARILGRPRGPRYDVPAPAAAAGRRNWLRFWKKPALAPASPVRIGATQAEILGRLGPPLQRTHFTETEAWSYRIPVPAPAPDGIPRYTQYRSLIVLFRNYKVFDLSWEDPGPDFGSISVD